MDMSLRRMRPPFVLLAAIGLAAGACKSSDAPPPPVSPPDLQMVSAGAEPRQLLRYHPVAGTTQKLEVAIDIELDAGGMGGPMPTLVMSLIVSVDAQLPTGAVKLHATIEGVVAQDVAESKVTAASLATTLEPMKGIGFDAILAPNGRLSTLALDVRAQQLPATTKTSLGSLVNSFEQTMMPLPEVPVGPGAVWRSSRPITRDGMKLTSVSSVTLESIKGTQFGYTIESTLHGDDQTARDGSDSVDVKDITGTGGGKGSVDLATLAVTSVLIAELRTKMSAPGDTEPTEITMATATKIRPL
jgi:hypothetical protein